jgi:uncharacterized cupin superfamily protein
MHPAIINLDQADLEPLPQSIGPAGGTAQRYKQRSARIGKQLGARKLGYRLIALEPGMQSCPFHSHRVNEEMFHVLAGTGEIRIGEGRFPIRAGDIIACPPGGPETAHQIVNSSTGELRYLAISTQESPDICEYPDSDKFMVFDDANEAAPRFYTVGKKADAVDYWDGE